MLFYSGHPVVHGLLVAEDQAAEIVNRDLAGNEDLAERLWGVSGAFKAGVEMLRAGHPQDVVHRKFVVGAVAGAEEDPLPAHQAGVQEDECHLLGVLVAHPLGRLERAHRVPGEGLPFALAPVVRTGRLGYAPPPAGGQRQQPSGGEYGGQAVAGRHMADVQDPPPAQAGREVGGGGRIAHTYQDMNFRRVFKGVVFGGVPTASAARRTRPVPAGPGGRRKRLKYLVRGLNRASRRKGRALI